MSKICAPALIYVVFSLTQIIIDTIKGLYNTAFLKFIVSILITILLDGLCKGGMGIVSWIIVFIPFIFMTVIVTILLYVFGLDIATGKLNINCDNENSNQGGNLIFSTSNNNDNSNNNDVINDDYYDPDSNNNTTIKHITLTSDDSNDDNNDDNTNNNTLNRPYLFSSDPQYQS